MSTEVIGLFDQVRAHIRERIANGSLANGEAIDLYDLVDYRTASPHDVAAALNGYVGSPVNGMFTHKYQIKIDAVEPYMIRIFFLD